MRVKFLESCASGEVYAKNSVHDLPADVAKRHIASGAAAPYSDDEEVHTAVESMEGVKKAIKKRS